LSRAKKTLAQIGPTPPASADFPKDLMPPTISSNHHPNNDHSNTHHPKAESSENGKLDSKNMDSKLRCEKCGAEVATPTHCDRQMHVETVDGAAKLVCWMGPGCAVADIPAHCGERMHEVRTV
jgi:hypothetical protein